MEQLFDYQILEPVMAGAEVSAALAQALLPVGGVSVLAYMIACEIRKIEQPLLRGTAFVLREIVLPVDSGEAWYSVI